MTETGSNPADIDRFQSHTGIYHLRILMAIKYITL